MDKDTDYILMILQHIVCRPANNDTTAIVRDFVNDPGQRGKSRIGISSYKQTVYDKTTVWRNKTNSTIGGDVDASIVTTHMMLAAAELGLGTTWVGAFDHQKARELFNIPDYLVSVALLPIGYPADDVEPHPWHWKRFDMDHTVFYNSFNGITEGEAH